MATIFLRWCMGALNTQYVESQKSGNILRIVCGNRGCFKRDQVSWKRKRGSLLLPRLRNIYCVMEDTEQEDPSFVDEKAPYEVESEARAHSELARSDPRPAGLPATCRSLRYRHFELLPASSTLLSNRTMGTTQHQPGSPLIWLNGSLVSRDQSY